MQAGFSSDGAAEPTREGGNEGPETVRNNEPEGPPKKRRRDRKRKLNKADDHEQTQVPNKSGSSAKKDGQDKNGRRQASSESRRTKRIRERMAGTTCFVCREIGHTAKECQMTAEDTGKSVVGICYRYVFTYFCTVTIPRLGCIIWTINTTNIVATIAGVARQDTIYRDAKNLSTSFTHYRLHRVLYVTEKATSHRRVLRTSTRGYTQTEGAVSYAVIHLI